MEEFLSLQFRGIPDSVFIISFLILSILIVLVFMLRKNPRSTRRAVFSMLLVEYVFLMFCSTVICRETKDVHRLELVPFWNYHDVLLSGNPMHYWEVLLNIALYTPIGFLLSGLRPSKSDTYSEILNPRLPLKGDLKTGAIRRRFNCVFVLSICIGLSVVTEVLQYVLHRGLCETDDVIHNAVGGLLGYGMYLGACKTVRTVRLMR